MHANRLTVLAVVMVTGLVVLLGAGAAMQAQPTATAVADVQKIFDSLREKTAVEGQLRSRQERLEQQLASKRNEVAQLRQDLGVLAPGGPDYQEKEDQLRKAAVDLRVWAEVEQQRVVGEQVIQVESLYRKTLDTVAQVARDNGYDIVLYKEPAPNFDVREPQDLLRLIQLRKVLFAADSIDITEQVVQRMNNAFDAGQ